MRNDASSTSATAAANSDSTAGTAEERQRPVTACRTYRPHAQSAIDALGTSEISNMRSSHRMVSSANDCTPPSTYRASSNSEMQNDNAATRPTTGAIVGRSSICCTSATVPRYDILRGVKFAITLLLIVALAAAAFFVGWSELALPAGSYGVAFTKSGGWDTEVTVPGGVTWRWERLIPTNMTLYVFDLTPQTVRRRAAARLPSAELYAAEIKIDPAELSYDVGITVRLRLRPGDLPQLAAEEDLRPETLTAWYEQAAAAAGDAAAAALLSQDAAALVTGQALAERTRRWLAGRRPELEITSVELTPHSTIPDPDLYARAKAAMAERIDTQHRARLAVLEDLALASEQARQHADMLGRLGETLAKFPELADLLSRSPADLLGPVLGVPLPAADPGSTPQEPPAGP